ncbi:MAG: cytochrome c [Elusimicrobia bacterium]|nr:cytochrome c [Elusimicrobiota bacterium]
MSRFGVRLGLAAAACALAGLVEPPSGRAQEAVDDFRQNCFSCHTIGGGALTGPDLKDVSKRRTQDWATRFLLGPRRMIESGDSDAVKLRDEFRGVVMPDIAGMTPARAEALLRLIDAESKVEKSKFRGLSLIDRPLLPADAAAGRELFLGRVRLRNGAPSCISCHSVGGEGRVFGGGALGPDLTEASARLGGAKALAAWLMSPLTPLMKPVFQRQPLHESEILPLVAFLQQAAETQRPAGPQSRLPFLIAGIGGGVFFLVAFDSVWKGRLRSVRRRMVDQSRLPEGRDE